ncbi:MAG: hypothetical protein R3C53_09920 [Pirellulaceae bacterium]
MIEPARDSQTLPSPPNDPFNANAEDWKLGPIGVGNTYVLFNFSGKAECDGCYLEFQVYSRAGSYYRRKNGVMVDYQGNPEPEKNDPRNFASFVIIKTCITAANCNCGPVKDFEKEELTSGVFYSNNGLGTFIQLYQGLREADCNGAWSYTTCDPEADHLGCLTARTVPGDGVTGGSDGAAE